MVILQDAVELVLLAALIELEVDKEKNIESFSLDQMIGELTSRGIRMPKTGTVKAMNKQRVILKHYGQTVEIGTARRYLAASKLLIDEVLERTIGENLSGIFLHCLVTNEETKGHFSEALEALGKQEYFSALTAIRKAIYVEIEFEYSVYGWREEADNEVADGIFGIFRRGGAKAPYYSRNPKWISQHVEEPFEYIQIDHRTLRDDLVEWGVNTLDFWNVWRLTPKVFRSSREADWQVRAESKFFTIGASEENVRYCLEAAINIVLKKQDHFDLIKHLSGSTEDDFIVKTSASPTPVYSKATSTAPVVYMADKGAEFPLSAVVPGLESGQVFVRVSKFTSEEPHFVSGYIAVSDIERPSKTS